MRPDDVIELCKLWGRMTYGDSLPTQVVIASRDWLAYVQAMAAALPDDDTLVQVLEDDVHWAWPDGVTIVFEQPLALDHIIISTDDPYIDTRASTRLTSIVREVPPHVESQLVRGLAIKGSVKLTETRLEDGTPGPELAAHSMLWIGDDPADTVTGRWLPGLVMRPPQSEQGASLGLSQSTRFSQAAIAALGHRLTRIGPPVTAGRGERRRVQRELPSLRMLELSSGATVSRSSDDAEHAVEWSKRWMVRGHWRLQPYGAQRKLRRLKWIDPYVKGPEDKPLDVRPTVWKAHAPNPSNE